MNQEQSGWLKGWSGGRWSEFPRWRDVEPDGGWHDWWDEEGLWGCVECHWPDDDGQVGAGEQSLS